MYLAASLALLADLTPSHLLVPSAALFMFFVTIIAGNCPLLVPLTLNVFIDKTYHTFSIMAAPGEGEPGEVVQYLATERSGEDLQWVMIATICALYVVSSFIYFIVMCMSPPSPPSRCGDSDCDSDSDNGDHSKTYCDDITGRHHRE